MKVNLSHEEPNINKNLTEVLTFHFLSKAEFCIYFFAQKYFNIFLPMDGSDTECVLFFSDADNYGVSMDTEHHCNELFVSTEETLGKKLLRTLSMRTLFITIGNTVNTMQILKFISSGDTDIGKKKKNPLNWFHAIED